MLDDPDRAAPPRVRDRRSDRFDHREALPPDVIEDPPIDSLDPLVLHQARIECDGSLMRDDGLRLAPGEPTLQAADRERGPEHETLEVFGRKRHAQLLLDGG